MWVKIASRTERDLFNLLGLPYVPPVLREGGRVIGSAKELKRIVRTTRVDLHTHTHYSDGQQSVDEMCKQAIANGLEVLGISDHVAPAAYGHVLMNNATARKNWMEEITIARKKYAPEYHPPWGKLTVLLGAEVDVRMDGSLQVPDDLVKRADYLIASCHVKPSDNLTERLLKAMDHPKVRVLGHPTGRLLGSRPEGQADWEAIVKKAVAKNVAIEINGQPERLDFPEHLLPLAAQHGCWLVLTSDAHSSRSMKQLLHNARHVARRAKIPRRFVLRNAKAIKEWL
jgi:DNA polymerase (family 10)